jgi:Mg-chelatase subunit ChlD
MDVGFIVDASGSIGRNWRHELRFVQRLAAQVGISKSGGRAAVTLFSSKAKLMIKFSDHSQLSTFNRAVNRLPFWRKYTSIDKALDVASNEMFQQSNGMRPSVSKTLVFITDGDQFPFRKVDYAGMKAKFEKAKIKVIVVGVGRVNSAQLSKLVKDEKDLYLARNFNVLRKDSFINNMVSCDATTKPTQTK